MKQEIEARTQINNINEILSNLDRLGFKEVSNFVQHDIMFDFPDGRLFKSGQKIRIREENGKCELTYKGKFDDQDSLSVRDELNIPILSSTLNEYRLFLSALGYPALFEIKKLRRKFVKESLFVTVDEWPIIGNLVEIEGNPEEINKYKFLIAPNSIYRNYRLKELFEEMCLMSGKTLEELIVEYESSSDYKLGNIKAIFS